MGLMEQVGLCLILYTEEGTHLPFIHSYTHPRTAHITLWITSSLALDRTKHKGNNRFASLICTEHIGNLIPGRLDM